MHKANLIFCGIWNNSYLTIGQAFTNERVWNLRYRSVCLSHNSISPIKKLDRLVQDEYQNEMTSQTNKNYVINSLLTDVFILSYFMCQPIISLF